MKYAAGLILIMLFTACSPIPREVGAFDNGLNDVNSLDDKAALLKKLGYSGVAWRPKDTAPMLEALDCYNLKMHSTYVVLSNKNGPFQISPELKAEIEALKGRDTIVWLTLVGEAENEEAVQAIRQVADLASENNLEVSLYPHKNFKTSTVQVCLDLLKDVQRENVGMTFNLCHFLSQNNEADLGETLRSTAPHLNLVTLNGADSGDTRKMKWDQLIQPFGQGSYDPTQLLDLLDEVDYHGPILFQCYNIKAPAPEHLAQSMTAWEAMLANR